MISKEQHEALVRRYEQLDEMNALPDIVGVMTNHTLFEMAVREKLEEIQAQLEAGDIAEAHSTLVRFLDLVPQKRED